MVDTQQEAVLLSSSRVVTALVPISRVIHCHQARVPSTPSVDPVPLTSVPSLARAIVGRDFEDAIHICMKLFLRRYSAQSARQCMAGQSSSPMRRPPTLHLCLLRRCPLVVPLAAGSPAVWVGAQRELVSPWPGRGSMGVSQRVLWSLDNACSTGASGWAEMGWEGEHGRALPWAGLTRWASGLASSRKKCLFSKPLSSQFQFLPSA